jgi:hypothetical protein
MANETLRKVILERIRKGHTVTVKKGVPAKKSLVGASTPGQSLEGGGLMDEELDRAIDDLTEAASLPEARRAFEVDVCRKRLEAHIEQALEETWEQAELGCG